MTERKNESTPSYTVIKDTREQEGYFFKPYSSCQGMVEQKLDTGDYTILGLEDKLCIERKGCVEELAMNLGSKRNTFFAEIQRMESFPHKYLILEFTLDDLLKFPDESRIPAKYLNSVKVSNKYMMKCLCEFQLYNNIQVVFCGNKYNAFMMVSSIMKRVNEKYTTGRIK